MADDVVLQSATLASPAAGERISAEEVTTLNSGVVTAQKVQRILQAIRTGDATVEDVTPTAPLPVRAPSILRPTTGAITQTVAASYAANDYVGQSATPLQFPSAVRSGIGSGFLVNAHLVDKAKQNAVLELWLFDRSVTVPNDSAAFSISDADLQFLLGVIQFSSYFDAGAGSISMGTLPNNGQLAVWANSGTTLYGALVYRSGNTTWTTGDLSITLTVSPD